MNNNKDFIIFKYPEYVEGWSKSFKPIFTGTGKCKYKMDMRGPDELFEYYIVEAENMPEAMTYSEPNSFAKVVGHGVWGGRSAHYTKFDPCLKGSLKKVDPNHLVSPFDGKIDSISKLILSDRDISDLHMGPPKLVKDIHIPAKKINNNLFTFAENSDKNVDIVNNPCKPRYNISEVLKDIPGMPDDFDVDKAVDRVSDKFSELSFFKDKEKLKETLFSFKNKFMHGNGYEETYQDRSLEHSQECYDAFVRTLAKNAMPSDIKIFSDILDQAYMYEFVVTGVFPHFALLCVAPELVLNSCVFWHSAGVSQFFFETLIFELDCNKQCLQDPKRRTLAELLYYK